MTERQDPMPIDSDWFIERIAERGLSMNRVAKLLNKNPANLCRMIHGNLALQISDVEPLADILGVSVEVIVRKATRGKQEVSRRKSG